MLLLDAWVYSKLNTGALVDKVYYAYPNNFCLLPVLAYVTSQATSDMDYQDDFAQYYDAKIELDLYSQNEIDDNTTLAAIDTIMQNAYFNLDTCIPVPDPDTKLQHKHLEYSRRGLHASDLT
jgi:hypothetical protein